MSTPRPLVIAHRGASGYRPEHTRAAYELAVALGAEAIEPDIVATRDGVLVLRHENEISGTTDIASRPEFADRRTTKRVDGVSVSGWFTEDFTWAELATVRATERIPQVRPASATFDGTQPILRLRDLLGILDAAADRGREVKLVAEIKHATHFAGFGLPLDELVAAELAGWDDGERTIVESFEQSVLSAVRERGIPGRYVYLLEATGAAADLVARDGRAAATYAAQLSDTGLAALAAEVDGVSVEKKLIVGTGGGAGDLVGRVHAAGLLAFTWTFRPENRFLEPANRVGTATRDWGDWRRELGLIRATGVDGIFFDHPDLGLGIGEGVGAET